MTRSCSQVTICFCYNNKMSATNPPNQSRLVHHQSAALSTLNSLVDKSFICSICLGTFKGPNLIPKCLHHFCDTCIKESIQQCSKECPACRARIASRRDLRKDHLLQDIVSEKRCCGCCLIFSSTAVHCTVLVNYSLLLY